MGAARTPREEPLNTRRLLASIPLTLALAALLAIPGPLSAQDVEQILERSGALTRIENLSGELTLTVVSPGGDRRVTRVTAYQKRRSPEREDRLFVFTFPPNVRGTALLVHSNINRGEDSMWLYLPAVGRVKRVDLSTAGGGYFMGSDFTFRDLISRDDAEYVHTLLDDAPGSDGHHVLDVRGRTPELQREFGYSREEHYIRKDDFVAERILFYDLAGDLLKELTVLELYREDGLAYPSRVHMINHQTGHVSEIVAERLSFTDDIPDRYFTHRYLQRQ
ncbi:MAG: outer membrane lipoprotein-sorting protein [Spirochaetaceae bacterium]|nr:outer membrane lipoprotein-sorting protein [Spirochaetaceae bacterium]